MDPIILDMTAVPAHDAAPPQSPPATVAIVAEWPAGTFLENLLPLPDGSVVVAVLSEARLDLVTPAGERRTFRQLAAPPTGLALDGDAVLACVGEPGSPGHAIWRIDLATGEGGVAAPVPAALFLNGLTWLTDGVLLAADSALGCLFRIDLRTGAVDQWLAHELLSQAPGVPQLPGANGLKRFGDGVTVTSNGRALLLRAAVMPDGSAGPLSVVAERLRADDIAFDTAGNLYLTTHIGGTLDKLTPAGARTTLAGLDQGLAGSTACAFGAAPGTKHTLYVTTTGGIVNPVDGALQPARLLAIALDTPGHPVAPTWGAAS